MMSSFPLDNTRGGCPAAPRPGPSKKGCTVLRGVRQHLSGPVAVSSHGVRRFTCLNIRRRMHPALVYFDLLVARRFRFPVPPPAEQFLVAHLIDD